MDFVTHAAVGALVGRAVVPRDGDGRTGARYATAGAIAASLPDVDHVLEWFGADAYILHHRSATHSFLFLGLALAAAILMPGPGRAARAKVITAGIGSHLFLDVLTPFGTGLGWPFTEVRVSLDVLPIVAPWMIGLSLLGLALATVAAWRSTRLGRRAAWAALGVLSLFVGLEGLVAVRAAAAVPERGQVLALPHPQRPWQAVAFAAGDGAVREYRVDLDGTATLLRSTPRIRAERPEEVEQLLALASVRPFLDRYRLWSARVEGDRVVIEDVQYDHVTLDTEPTWIVVSGEGGGTVQAHQVALGLQPFAWAAVVALAWGAGRFRMRRPGSVRKDTAKVPSAS